MLGLVGRLVALALLVGAGLAGWLAVDRYVVAEPAAWGVVPAAGDGLPTEHVDGVDLPRTFRLDHTGNPEQAESRWFDLDVDVVATRTGTIRREFHAGRGFERNDGGTWIEMDAAAAVATRRSAARGAGPFLLTDVVPPASLPYVTILADEMITVADDASQRRITLTVDVAAFRDDHPVAVAEWRGVLLSIEPGRQSWTIDVGSDGIVRRLEQGDVVRTWTPLSEPVGLESPLALDVAADSAAGVGASRPPADAGP